MFITLKQFFDHKQNNANGAAWLLIALLTAITSEIKIVPFEAVPSFRFGLGSIVFFLLILIRPPQSFLRAGVVTGITVVCFRLLEDVLLREIFVWTSLESHLPAFLFYLIFSIGLHLIKIEKYKTSPLLLGCYAALFEFIGNGAEQIVRQVWLNQVHLGFREWLLLLGVALFRSFFVVGLYSSITVVEQRKRMQEMLEVGSELYSETLYLQKAINHIEKVTASSHDLYRKLKKLEQHQLGIQALDIAQEIHEVKKDSQRILSGLSKITIGNQKHQLLLSEVMNFVVSANKKYSELLKKDIQFQADLSIDFVTDRMIQLLAIFNNLMANSVESIMGKGEIHFEIFEKTDHICFVISDSGQGIPKEEVSIIFEPGYTTKFNEQGVAATGIGLSHVQEIVRELEGEIQVETPKKGAVFTIVLPMNQIRK